jgi:hypothetical protein
MHKRFSCCPVHGVLLGLSLLAQGALAGEVDLRLEGGTVSGTIVNAPLSEVAHALGRQGGVEMRLLGPDLSTVTVSLRLDRAPLAKAVKEILKDMSYAAIAAPPGQRERMRVLVYSRRGTASGHGTQPSARASVPDPTPAVGTVPPVAPEVIGGDPASRAAALESAVASHGAQGLPLALAAEQDPDATVRHASEELILGDLRDAVGADDMGALALRADRSDIRQRALEALAERPVLPTNLRDILHLASGDDDAGVRAVAENLLAHLYPSP